MYSAAAEDRLREVRDRFAELGLERIARRFPGKPSDDGRVRGRAIRQALEDLGPVFASFGVYLSSRIDLLPAGFCEELAAIPDLGIPGSEEYVRQVIERDLGSMVEDVFPFFECEPFESRLLHQCHRARLADGVALVVRIACPDARLRVHDLQLLRLTFDAFGEDDEGMEAAADDFRTGFCDAWTSARKLSRLRLRRLTPVHPKLCAFRQFIPG
jgi:predicted unusual protein kinase regulating ubiquinone biosynthesis (AarF/ABC1/UbiB family)